MRCCYAGEGLLLPVPAVGASPGCEGCQQGKYAVAGLGVQTCAACSPGRSAGYGASICESCPAGRIDHDKLPITPCQV